MTPKSVTDWQGVLSACGVRPAVAGPWAPVFSQVLGPSSFSAGLAAELPWFLGQILHESQGLERLEENLNYSAERMCQVWPRRFPSVADAMPYARNPMKLANHVYGGRLGNTRPGDGWDFRGSGLIQVTGYDNTVAVGKAMGWPGDPRDLAAALRTDPETALMASLMWWERRIPDSAMGDVPRLTRLVNGGNEGLASRQHLSLAALKAAA